MTAVLVAVVVVLATGCASSIYQGKNHILSFNKNYPCILMAVLILAKWLYNYVFQLHLSIAIHKMQLKENTWWS